MTLTLVLMAALVVLSLIVTGPVAQAVGDAVGLGDAAVTAWNIAKWPVMLFVVMLMLAILYWSAPNAKPAGFRWISPGSVVAVLVWIAASAAFAFYVANFGSYNKTYGALAGVIVFLVWMWITNIAVLLGAEINAETERAREIEAGVPGAEEEIQAPLPRCAEGAAREGGAREGGASLTLSFVARRADVVRDMLRALLVIAVWAVVAVVAVKSWPDARGGGHRQPRDQRRDARRRPALRSGGHAAGPRVDPRRDRQGPARGAAADRRDRRAGGGPHRPPRPATRSASREMTIDDAVVNFDVRSLNGERAIDRDVVVLHELGHVIDFQLIHGRPRRGSSTPASRASARAATRPCSRPAPAPRSRSASPTRSPSGRCAGGSRSPAPATASPPQPPSRTGARRSA